MRQYRPLIGLSILTALATAIGPQTDFRVYWEAARAFLDSGWGAVYDPQSYTPYKYHPVFIYPFVLFAWVPWPVAKVVWALLNGLWLWDAGRRFSQRLSLTPRVMAVSVLFVIHAFTWQVKFANVTIFQVWVFSLVIFYGFERFGAFYLSLMILLKPIWGPLLLLWVKNKKGLLVILSCLVGLSVLPLLGGVEPYLSWWETLTAPLHAHNYSKGDNQSLFGLLSRFPLERWTIWGWFLGATASGMFWLYTVTRIRDDQYCLGAIAAVPFILFAAPLNWIHHQIWLWPLFALCLKKENAVWLAVIWLLLNGTGEGIVGRSGFKTAHFWGLPLVGYLLCQWLMLRCSRSFSNVK